MKKFKIKKSIKEEESKMSKNKFQKSLRKKRMMSEEE